MARERLLSMTDIDCFQGPSAVESISSHYASLKSIDPRSQLERVVEALRVAGCSGVVGSQFKKDEVGRLNLVDGKIRVVRVVRVAHLVLELEEAHAEEG